jgi:hypothetical protein
MRSLSIVATSLSVNTVETDVQKDVAELHALLISALDERQRHLYAPTALPLVYPLNWRLLGHHIRSGSGGERKYPCP